MATEDIARLAELLEESKDANRAATVLTGAGISTESGIPDFRSPGTGLYTRIDPMEYLSRRALESAPAKFWKCFSDLYRQSPEYQPNDGHRAIAKLEGSGHVGAVVTQNIDNLHQKAGSENVLEVHGHLRTVHCTACGRTFEFTFAIDQVTGTGPHRPKARPAGAADIPLCSDCESLLRPDVVLFGDEMTEDFARAGEVVRSSPLLVVVGSSLSVSPVNYFAFEAEHLAIINREVTVADRRAEVVIRGGAGESLTALVSALGVA